MTHADMHHRRPAGLAGWLALAGVLGFSTMAAAQNTNQITTVTPDSAAAGAAGIVVTFGLDTDAPPPPPTNVLPNSVTIGTIAGTALTHPTQATVTATFNIPAGEAAGYRSVAVVFSTPNGTLTFSKANGFRVVTGSAAAPTITGHPRPVTVAAGGGASFSVTASGSAPLHYQWQKEAADIEGAIAATYAIAPVTAADSGSYRCVVTNGLGSATSNGARLTVIVPVIDGYPVVDTGQSSCYDSMTAITCPAIGQPYHGQDAQQAGAVPSFTLSADGLTVHDNVTGLTWQRSPEVTGPGSLTAADKLTWTQAQARPAALNAVAHGGFTDWRLPTIKELYSLIDFRGTDPSGLTGNDTSGLTPFIDTDYFQFAYGDVSAGERIIDSQYASSTLYVATTTELLLFGVNFADGRIKGYGLTINGSDKTFFVQCVRGPSTYGLNWFVDNGDGTVTDRATGLMWMKSDSGLGLNWPEALAWADARNAAGWLGHGDWRLPTAKELQSLVDYTRSPDTHGTAAIDPAFSCTGIVNEAGQADYPCYWASTTHGAWNGSGAAGAYVAFGRAMGYMNGSWRDVHGAGCQRSDPKTGNPADYPTGRGPQGDAIRIYNYVRLVRDTTSTSGSGPEPPLPAGFGLAVTPNPARGAARIRFSLPAERRVTLRAFDIAGRLVRTILDEPVSPGDHVVPWDALDAAGRAVPTGIYLLGLEVGGEQAGSRVLVIR